MLDVECSVITTKSLVTTHFISFEYIGKNIFDTFRILT